MNHWICSLLVFWKELEMFPSGFLMELHELTLPKALFFAASSDLQNWPQGMSDILPIKRSLVTLNSDLWLLKTNQGQVDICVDKNKSKCLRFLENGDWCLLSSRITSMNLNTTFLYRNGYKLLINWFEKAHKHNDKPFSILVWTDKHLNFSFTSLWRQTAIKRWLYLLFYIGWT